MRGIISKYQLRADQISHQAFVLTVWEWLNGNEFSQRSRHTSLILQMHVSHQNQSKKTTFSESRMSQIEKCVFHDKVARS